ncbi:hypothetical protein BV20DRAFT_671770 [Pilatotrama ljubarskyi]|nr:hypothetical protein BV20DRAFT_671770 [Pilatotrama ljubarskyi]
MLAFFKLRLCTGLCTAAPILLWDSEVQCVVQRQNDIFLRLTNFAAAVQSCTEQCETVERETREKRDAAGRQLVALYALENEDTETRSLTTTSYNDGVRWAQVDDCRCSS